MKLFPGVLYFSFNGKQSFTRYFVVYNHDFTRYFAGFNKIFFLGFLKMVS